MLVLTRKRGERILIGDDIVITIMDVRGDGVRVGIEAPAGVRINRAEVIESVGQANVEATGAADDSATLAGLLATRRSASAATPQTPEGAQP